MIFFHFSAVIISLVICTTNIIGFYAKTVNLNCTTDEELHWIHPCYIKEAFDADEGDEINVVNDGTHFDAFQIMSESHLTFVPSVLFEKFPNLRRIHFSTGVKSLAQDTFKNANQLSAIILRENAIEILSFGVFSNAPELREIDLSMNKISEIEDNAFEGLRNLRNLMLSYNHLKTIRRSTFAGLPELSLLDLEHNEIETVNDGCFSLPQLKTLFLGHNKIKRLTDRSFLGAIDLRAIDIRANGLTHIGHSLTGLKELASLILDNNEIIDLKLEDFVKLPRIHQKFLRSSGLKVINIASPSTTSLKQKTLKILDLSENQLKNPNILKHLAAFAELEELKLDGNDFETIDHLGEIRHSFVNFRNVSVSNNQFKCDWLQQVLVQLNNTDVLIYGSTLDTEQKNIDGIVCY